MTDMKHTPDRIWATGHSGSGSWNTQSVNNKRIQIPEHQYLLATPTREAADELLEALEYADSIMTVFFDGRGIQEAAIQKARAAIAKAKGEGA